jgi:nucleotide-binding universal stress UspA family protein
MCALEPIPVVPEAPNYDLTHYYAMLEDQIAHRVWPLVESLDTEKVTRYGTAGDTILQEATEWGADLVVVGSHGKGWVDRLLIGSVTERLLNRLPTSLLVVPVYALVASQEGARRMERRPAFA